MKHFIYFVLLYLFLPFNANVDFIIILIFFIIFNEDEKFALIFSFFCGLLIDLYYPVFLGVSTFLFTLLAQLLIYLKKYITRKLVTTFITFTIFYIVKVVALYIAFASPIRIHLIPLTIISFLPLFFVLNRITYGIWMKT
jgi:rod shape-determining protein MreD